MSTKEKFVEFVVDKLIDEIIPILWDKLKRLPDGLKGDPMSLLKPDQRELLRLYAEEPLESNVVATHFGAIATHDAYEQYANLSDALRMKEHAETFERLNLALDKIGERPLLELQKINEAIETQNEKYKTAPMELQSGIQGSIDYLNTLKDIELESIKSINSVAEIIGHIKLDPDRLPSKSRDPNSPDELDGNEQWGILDKVLSGAKYAGAELMIGSANAADSGSSLQDSRKGVIELGNSFDVLGEKQRDAIETSLLKQNQADLARLAESVQYIGVAYDDVGSAAAEATTTTQQLTEALGAGVGGASGAVERLGESINQLREDGPPALREVRDAAQELSAEAQSAAGGISNAIKGFLKGDLSLGDLGKSILSSLEDLVINRFVNQIINPLIESVVGGIDKLLTAILPAQQQQSTAPPSSGTGLLGTLAQGLLGLVGFGGTGATGSGSGGHARAALGAAFYHGNVIALARGGIVTAPSLFPMRGGVGLMGEAGPEGILPLRRGPGGRLGVEGGGPVNVNIINNAGADIRTRRRQSGSGTDIEVMIDQAVARNIARGGATSHAIQTAFGVRHAVGAR